MNTLGYKTVKRSNVKYNGGTGFPFNRCDYAAMKITTLNQQKRNEHALSFNASLPLKEHKQSTRNNSILENLMLDDISLTSIEKDNITLEEMVLKYTCMDCKFVTKNKTDMDSHVDTIHSSRKNKGIREM